MRYISALKVSTSFKKLHRVTTLGSFLILLVILISAYRAPRHFDSIPLRVKALFLLVILTGVGSQIFVQNLFQRQTAVEVEVDRDGVRHLRPGKAQTFGWNEVKSAQVQLMGRNPPTLILKTEYGRYRFDPFLAADRPDAPKLTFSIMGRFWLYSDGRKLPMSVENSAGWQILKEYRPDLLPKLPARASIWKIK
ncbi:MAG: hypothetical protein FJY65_08950 [Calditrichaeota bacterium]|nr:hypothetical protein [Calditrichota bacterium]